MTTIPHFNKSFCKGLCDDLKVRKFDHARFAPYKLGYRYCSMCCVYLNLTNKHCPCCGLQLRKTARLNRDIDSVKRY